MSPLSSTHKTRLEEQAKAVWTLGADGEPSGVENNPVHVVGEMGITGAVQVEGSVDDITGAAVGIDVVHHEIHEGETFLVSYKTADGTPLADDATLSFGLTTGAKYVHLAARAAMGGDGEGEMYEGSTLTGGTATTVHNKNRPLQGIEVSTVAVVRDPTVNAAGLLLENEFLPGGTGPQAVGGVASQRAEWVLKPGTVYLVRITNRAGNNQPASLALEWYEESTNG